MSTPSRMVDYSLTGGEVRWTEGTGAQKVAWTQRKMR